jgi:feruloyl esterase
VVNAGAPIPSDRTCPGVLASLKRNPNRVGARSQAAADIPASFGNQVAFRGSLIGTRRDAESHSGQQDVDISQCPRVARPWYPSQFTWPPSGWRDTFPTMIRPFATLSALVHLGFAITANSTACDSLERVALVHVTGSIDLAVSLPDGSNFSGTTAEPGYNAPQLSLPSVCRVRYTINTSNTSSAIGEVWLPGPESWNARLLAVGNGGFAGGVNYPDVVWGLRKGFATTSTNTGHSSSSSDGLWLGNEEQTVDWGHRALHLSTIAAKEIVQKYYSSAAAYSYYAGCSTGGRQGLNAAQRYPKDYNGVLVGSAIPWQTHTSAWQTYVALLQFPSNHTTYIPPEMWPVVHAEVLSQCDKLDGLADGIIMDPSKCTFHPETLLCGKITANSSACLTPSQLTNLKRMYQPWLESDGAVINPGISPGGESSFSILMNGQTPTFGPTFYANAVYNDTQWDWSRIDVDSVKLADKVNPGGSNAYEPDMRPFHNVGGKIIQYHGYADPLIPALNAGAWYDYLTSFLAGVGRANDVDDFYRLFAVPGMGHCSGGAGAWVLDGASQGGTVPEQSESDYSMLWSLVKWVESNGTDTEPDKIIGTRFVNNTASLGIDFTRPVCRWPGVAEFVGGNVRDAADWRCPDQGFY